ncbi:hypothetical protein EVAR_83442_1 [Eumeta japonica]|uniref:Uncharacterized protein n=1 Tax=Eumeta variegata TaxID=151549 RepID=A0A4C1TYJ6_EUMVA|nr:hypothetical protein EVAR_83442_1 [Eumeta japonica]
MFDRARVHEIFISRGRSLSFATRKCHKYCMQWGLHCVICEPSLLLHGGLSLIIVVRNRKSDRRHRANVKLKFGAVKSKILKTRAFCLATPHFEVVISFYPREMASPPAHYGGVRYVARLLCQCTNTLSMPRTDLFVPKLHPLTSFRS